MLQIYQPITDNKINSDSSETRLTLVLNKNRQPQSTLGLPSHDVPTPMVVFWIPFRISVQRRTGRQDGRRRRGNIICNPKNYEYNMKIRSGPKSLYIQHFTERQNTRSLTKPEQPTNFQMPNTRKTDTEMQNSNGLPQATPIWDRKTPRTHLHHRPAVDNSHQDPACGCQHRQFGQRPQLGCPIWPKQQPYPPVYIPTILTV